VKLRGDVQTIASALLDDTMLSIPAVREQRRLLDEVASDEWWVDVTLPMLETVRRRLRGLVKLLPKVRRGVVYFDFEDEQGEIRSTEIRGMPPGASAGRFVVRVRSYLRTHEHDPVVARIRGNQPVTAAELASLATVFVESGFGSEDDIEGLAAEHCGFGLFLRSLTGLDHDAAAAAFAFVLTQELNTPQRAYLQLLTDVLARNGLLKIDDLYNAPFTLRAPHGPEDLFPGSVIDRIAEVLTAVRANA
jgi:type I restriction enzyme R subunit